MTRTSGIHLSQTHPTIEGRRNSYRERWAMVGGQVWHVSAASLDDVWYVTPDTEHLAGAELLAYVQSPAYTERTAIAFTLAEAREKIAALSTPTTEEKRP